MEAQLKDFMKARGIPIAAIEEMESQKIDCYVLTLMDKDTLEAYIPLLGDQKAVQTYAKQFMQGTLERQDGSKDKLLQRLKKKLSMKRKASETPQQSQEPGSTSARMMGNTHAEKTSRKIDIGWIDYNKSEKDFKQVRIQNGGGTRHLSVSKDATREDLLKIAVDLFFPGGESAKGFLNEFSVEIRDFRRLVMSAETTVGELYSAGKMSNLRFYLATKKVDKKAKKSRDRDSDLIKDEDIPVAQEVQVPQDDSHSCSAHSETLEESNTSADKVIDLVNDEESEHLEPVVPGKDVDPFLSECICPSPISPVCNICDSDSETDKDDLPSFNLDGKKGLLRRCDDSLHMVDAVGLPSSSSTFLEETIPNTLGSNSFDEIVDNEDFTITVRRSLIVEDLINVFSDAKVLKRNIKVKMMMPNGNMEMGEGSGMYSEAITAFWNELSKTFAGCDVQVPCIRHDFGESSWEAVARIILKGWKDTKYFPINLATQFMEEAIYGSFSDTDLLETFLRFLALSERQIVESALQKFPDDTEELIDILDSYDCRRIPTSANLLPLLMEIAHQELIQRPRFIADCMRPVLRPMSEAVSKKALHQMYVELKPTPSKVVASLKFPDQMTPQESTTAGFLKKYIRSLHPAALKKFVRFCTGSDLMCHDNMSVTFTTLAGFARRPIGHACGDVLELPSTYESYVDLRKEFTEVFDAAVWVMDIA